MKLRKLLLPILMLMVQAGAFADGPTVQLSTPIMVVSYWGYVAFLPLMVVALVVYGWLSPRKRSDDA